MNDLGISIVISSVIIVMGAISITVSIITKKRYFAISYFSLLLFCSVIVVFFPKNVDSFFQWIHGEYGRKSEKFKNIIVHNIDDKSSLEDVLYYYGTPNYYSKESSQLFYDDSRDKVVFTFKNSK